MARKIRLATLWNPDLGRSSEGPARGPCESTAFEPWPAAVPLAFFLMSDPVCRSAAYPSRRAGRGGAGRCAVTTCDPRPRPGRVLNTAHNTHATFPVRRRCGGGARRRAGILTYQTFWSTCKDSTGSLRMTVRISLLLTPVLT
jgi:hypothetical protein